MYLLPDSHFNRITREKNEKERETRLVTIARQNHSLGKSASAVSKMSKISRKSDVFLVTIDNKIEKPV